ncbi:MAG: zinc ABC transporter substrate-binding protein [Scytonema sp. PMC 1069.18]|nr:zinc ABC transporter substrate-binding protein [Scytonema sp. PMC 1069.18]MEC4880713.1 zinc ABC transporter substrate-binding protein [Scytonema sp. PMC 1070.18]
MLKKVLFTKSLRIVLVTLTISFFGCNRNNVEKTSTTTTVSADELTKNLPKVVVTTSVLCDLTSQIAQQTINLTCLIPPNTNPLLYQPKPEDSKAIQQAKLILYNGYNLEQNFSGLIQESKNNELVVAVAQRAVPKPLQFKEDATTVPDPYVWHNVKNTSSMVEVISSYLSKAAPENATLYKSNAKKITNELAQLDAWINARIESIPERQRQLITSRDAMGYYAKAYGLSYAGAVIGISNQETPTSQRSRALIRFISKNRIPTVFVEATNNSTFMNTLAEQAEAKVSQRKLFADNLSAPGSEGESYQKMMVANTRTIVEGLGGTYLIFLPKAPQQPNQG